MIETDTDSKSVGLSAPVYFPEHSNELYTSGWSFGSLNTGQYLLNNIEGLHVPPEYNQGGSQWDRWRFGILFRSAEVQSHQIRILSRTTIRPTGTGVGIRMQNEDGTWPSADWASTSESYAIETTVFMVVNATRAINWSVLPLSDIALTNAPRKKYDHIDELRDAVNDRLSTKNEDETCEEKLNELLKKLNKNAGDIRSILSNIYSENKGYKLRITNSVVATRASAATIVQPFLFRTSREIVFNNNPAYRDYADPSMRQVTFNRDSFDLLHEILHVVGKRTANDHETIAQAINSIGGEKLPDVWGMTSEEADDAYSRYINRWLGKYCTKRENSE